MFSIRRICNYVQYFLLLGRRVSDNSVSWDVLRLLMSLPLFLNVSFSHCTNAEFQINNEINLKLNGDHICLACSARLSQVPYWRTRRQTSDIFDVILVESCSRQIARCNYTCQRNN